MIVMHLYMEILAVLLGVLDLVVLVTSDWTQKPQELHVCLGRTASFRWNFDDAERNATRVTIAKDDRPPTIMLDKMGSDEARITDSRVTYRENAGMTLKQLNLGDAGNYTCSVYFSNEEFNLIDTTALNVYDGCPQEKKFFNPTIYYTIDDDTRLLGGSTFNTSSEIPANIMLTITLPAALPAVIATVFKVEDSFADHKCKGVNTRDHNCTANLYFYEEGHYPMLINLEYPAYTKSENTIQLNLTATGTGRKTSLILAILVPVLVLILIVVIIFCQRKYGTMGFWYKCCDVCLGKEDTSNRTS